MNAGLTLEYEFSRDGDDFGWLIARVETPDFKAANGMWIQWQDVVKFGAALSTYPIEAANPVTCEWGFSQAGEYQAITKVAIAPERATGGLVVEVCLANYYDPRHRCQTRFQTDYPSVARLREQIEAMMGGEAPTAFLAGQELDGR